MSGRTYQCSNCGGTFKAGWSEAEALAEAAARFPGVPVAEMRQICDDCDQEFNRWFATLTDEDKARIEREPKQ